MTLETVDNKVTIINTLNPEEVVLIFIIKNGLMSVDPIYTISDENEYYITLDNDGWYSFKSLILPTVASNKGYYVQYNTSLKKYEIFDKNGIVVKAGELLCDTTLTFELEHYVNYFNLYTRYGDIIINDVMNEIHCKRSSSDLSTMREKDFMFLSIETLKYLIDRKRYSDTMRIFEKFKMSSCNSHKVLILSCNCR